jgi:hypothetical protein
MDKYLTTDEFVAVITQSLKNTLDRDFGADSKCHIVDLMTHATTGMEWMYQFVEAYGSIEHQRQLRVDEGIQSAHKKDKKVK